MQFRGLISLLIFIGSYLPLSLILLAQNFDYNALQEPFCWRLWDGNCNLPFDNEFFSVGIFIFCSVCFFVTLFMLRIVRPYTAIKVRSISYIPADLMNYSLPYVVSFMSLDYQDTGKFVGFLIFLSWMFWITHRSGQVLLNPVLIAFGWRYYDISYNFIGDDVERTANALVYGEVYPNKRYNQLTVQDVFIIKPQTGDFSDADS